MFSDKKLALSSQLASISLRVYDFNQINIGETVHLEQQKSYNKSILKTSRKIDSEELIHTQDERDMLVFVLLFATISKMEQMNEWINAGLTTKRQDVMQSGCGGWVMQTGECVVVCLSKLANSVMVVLENSPAV